MGGGGGDTGQAATGTGMMGNEEDKAMQSFQDKDNTAFVWDVAVS